MRIPVFDMLIGLIRVLFGERAALPPGISNVFGDGSV